MKWASNYPPALAIRVRLADYLSRYGRFDDALAVLDAVKPPTGAAAADASKQVFRQRLQVLIAANRRDLA
jgi:hypothetical protein